MVVQRSESVASSNVGSGFHEITLQHGVAGGSSEQDDLLQTSSFEAGIFGVLFTLSQEKSQIHLAYSWIILKNILTAWQLFTTILTPDAGWDIDPSSPGWKCVSVLTFNWLQDLGYTWYVVVLYSLAGVLTFNLALCVWVAWSFKEQKFDYVWPIKVVRGFSYVFLQVFDITTLRFLQLGISCNYFKPTEPRLHMALFPAYSCSTVPHVANAVLTGLLLIIFMVMSMLVNMSDVEVNPACRSPLSLGHSGAEVTAFAAKVLMTLVGVFTSQPEIASIVYVVLAAWLVWEYLRWIPHLLVWVNCVKTGVATAMFSVASIQVAVAFLSSNANKEHVAQWLTVIMGMSLVPAFLIGVLAAWLRTKLFTMAVLRAFRTTDPEAVKPQDVYHFYHPRDVEIAARSARVWVDLYTLEKTAVHTAERIIKAGIALWPEEAFVTLTYANFMLDVLGFSQTGARQLEGVRKLDPGIMCRFMLFVRQQQATQKAASSTVGKGGSMDLLGYVEYQRKQRLVLRYHKEALQAMANFWRILGTSSVAFTSLSRSLEDIDTSVSKAESAYRTAMELYNNSPRLVRLYARFLETIKQDPWGATRYYEAADRLEESKDYHGNGPSLPDGTPLSRMDDVEKGVLVVNAFGDIQVANRKLHDLFGYKKGDLDGKNVTVLMPPHEAKRHPALLRRYIDSGDKAAPYFRHPVLGIHRERVALTVRISVSRASGLGEDSVFIGILELVPMEPALGRMWVTREGVIVCCDPGFVTYFGYRPDDVIGTQLHKLLHVSHSTGGTGTSQAMDVWLTNQANHDKEELVQRMLSEAIATGDGHQAEPQALRCRVLHKYDFAKDCSVVIRKDATDASTLEVRLKLTSDEPQLLMVVERKGVIRHMSGDLAVVLGIRASSSGNDTQGAGGGGGQTGAPSGPHMAGDQQVMLELMAEAPPCTLDDFLPSPWKILHYKYRKYVKGGSPMLSGAWGCRAVLNDTANDAGPTMRLVGLHGKPVYVHVAVMSREEDGEPMHVIRMARSSLDTAITERRLRLRLAEDGSVVELDSVTRTSADGSDDGDAHKGASTGLFGFQAEQLIGCHLGQFLSVARMRKVAATTKQRLSQVDLLAEAEATLSDQSTSAKGVDDGGDGSIELQYASLDFMTLDAMITRTLQTPGISWRVHVISPRMAAEAAALGNPTRATALLSKMTREAILRLDVVLPLPEAQEPSQLGRLTVHAELWAVEAVTGVLEIDANGRVSGILEEEIRPPSLLFGLPKEDILGAQFASLIRFAPGQSAPGLLNDTGIAKKSALKASSKGKSSTKVGPVHYLDGFHRDQQPLPLAAQVVGKPGPGNPVTVILRLVPSCGPAAQSRHSKKHTWPRGRGSAADAAMAIVAATPYRAPHVLIAGAKDRDPAASGLVLKLSPSLRAGRPTTRNTASLPSVSKVESKPGQPSQGLESVGAFEQQALIDDKGLLPGIPQEPDMRPAVPSLRGLAPLALPSAIVPDLAVARGGASVAPSVGAGVRTGFGQSLPGANALAAGVAFLLKAKSASSSAKELAAGKDSAQQAAASSADDKGKAGRSSNSGDGGGGGPTRLDGAKDLKPERDSFGAAAVRDAGPKQDLLIYADSSALDAAGTSRGPDIDVDVDAIEKWVTSGDKLYNSRPQTSETVNRGNLEDDDEDDAVSLGGFSRAASSHYASPPRSEYGGLEDWYGTQPGPQAYRHGDLQDGGHQQQQQQQQQHGRMGLGGMQLYPHHQNHQLQQRRPQHLQHPRLEVSDVDAGGAAGPLVYGESEFDGTDGDYGVLAPATIVEVKQLEDHLESDGDSDDSGIADGSDASDAADPADYKRGKRYRKLIRLMNSPQARKAMVRLKINTMLAIFAAAAVHVLSFSLIMTGIKREEAAIDQLASVGGGQRYLQRALVSVRALDQAYRGKGTTGTYNASDSERFAEDILAYSNMYRGTNTRLLSKNDGKIENYFYTTKLNVWSGFNATTGLSYFEDIAIWDLITRVHVSAKTVYQNHITWRRENISISSKHPATFLLRSAQALSPGMQPVLDEKVTEAVQWTNWVNNLQLTFLLVEGCVVTLCTAIGLLYMLKSAFDQRYQLYETFLSIPIGLTRALAAQTTHLLDDDESDDPDDEDEIDHQDDNGSSRPRHQQQLKRKTFFEDSPLGRADSTLNHKQQDSALPKGAGSPLDHPKPGYLTVGAASGHHRHRSMASPSYSLYDSSRALEGYGGHAHEGKSRQSCWRVLLSKFRRPGSVRPHPHQPSPGIILDGGTSLGRRTLVRNSRVAKGMLSIVLVYSILVILFYSINYGILKNVKNKVAMQAVANYNAERTFRAIFYAQEVAACEDVSDLPAMVEALRNAIVSLRDAYYTARMGVNAEGVIGPEVEKFRWVDGKGLVKGSPDMFQIFYGHGACLRLQEHLPCLASSDRFYEVTHAGADGMMEQMLLELKQLADAATAAYEAGLASPGLNQSQWDYIYNVGTMDLSDANMRISQQHVLDVKRVLGVVVVMHVALFLLLTIAFLCFLVLGYLPLLRRMEKEKRRIAEMMSQLPPELDVMRLFSTALMGSKALHALRRRSLTISLHGGSIMELEPTMPATAPIVPPQAATVVEPDDDEADEKPTDENAECIKNVSEATGEAKGYQTWKDILSRTSVNGAAHSNPGQANAVGRPKGKA